MKNMKQLSQGSLRALDTLVSSEHVRIMHEAKAVGSRADLNALGGCAAHERSIAASYNSLMAKVRQVTRASAARTLGAIVKDRWEREDAVLVAEEGSAGAMADKAKLERDRIMISYDWKSHWVKAVAKWAIVAADGFVNAYAFTATGGSLLSAMPLAAAFALGLWACSTYAQGLLSRIADWRARTAAWAAYLLVLLSAFVAVAFLRVLFLGVPTWQVAFAVMAWASLNVFLFFCASMIAATYPSGEQVAAKSARDKSEREVSRLEARRDAVRAKREGAYLLAKEELDSYAERLVLERDYETNITAMADEAIACFRGESYTSSAYADRNVFDNKKRYAL